MAVLKLHVRSSRKPRAQGSGGKPVWPLPRLLLTSCFFVLLGLFMYVLWQSRWMERQAEAVIDGFWNTTAFFGFEVKDVVVEGRKATQPYDILQALGIQTGAPILAFRPDEAKENLKKLPWVGDATVERYLPGTVVVRLTERRPMTRWQTESGVRVLDMRGTVLESAAAGDFTDLPLVIGKGADETARDLFKALARFPAIGKHVQTATRISERRWDLLLDKRVVAKLPETNAEEALQRLSKAITEQRILERDVIAVDLRQADRLVIESSQPIAPIAKTSTSKP